MGLSVNKIRLTPTSSNWSGENAVYVGMDDLGNKVFIGLGLGQVYTEHEMQELLRSKYNHDLDSVIGYALINDGFFETEPVHELKDALKDNSNYQKEPVYRVSTHPLN